MSQDVRECTRRSSRGSRSLSPDSRKDRKSTRLNSSHGYISYAVFCLKKKKKHPNYKQGHMPTSDARLDNKKNPPTHTRPMLPRFFIIPVCELTRVQPRYA